MQKGGEFNSSREQGGVEKVRRRERHDTERQRRSCGTLEEKKMKGGASRDVHKTKV